MSACAATAARAERFGAASLRTLLRSCAAIVLLSVWQGVERVDAVRPQASRLPLPVVPAATLTGCSEGDWMLVDPVNLADTTSEGYGVALLCHQGQFGFACTLGKDVFSPATTGLFCESLGFLGSSGATLGLKAPSPALLAIPVVANGVNCPVGAELWDECSRSLSDTCALDTDAWHVVCLKIDRTISPPMPAETPRCFVEEERTFRLVNTIDHLQHAGRVEVCHNGYWGAICDDEADMDTAHFVCRELGFEGAFWHGGEAAYGAMQSDTPTWFELRCPPGATTLLQCSYPGWNVHDCSRDHFEDWSVACVPHSRGAELLPTGCTVDNHGSLRLVDTRDARLDTTALGYGTVEYCNGTQYTYICDDVPRGLVSSLGDTVCRQLGYAAGATRTWSRAVPARSRAIQHAERARAAGDASVSIPPDVEVFLDDVDCTVGTPDTLSGCTWNSSKPHNCQAVEAIAVLCAGSVTPFGTTVPLFPPPQIGAPIPCRADEEAQLSRALPNGVVEGDRLPESALVTGCFGQRRVTMCAPLAPPVWDASPQPYLDEACSFHEATPLHEPDRAVRMTPAAALLVPDHSSFPMPEFWMLCPRSDAESVLSDWSLMDCVFIPRASSPYAVHCTQAAALQCAPPVPPLGSPTGCEGDQGILFSEPDAQICLADHSDLIKRLERTEALVEALLRVALSSGDFEATAEVLKQAGLVDRATSLEWRLVDLLPVD